MRTGINTKGFKVLIILVLLTLLIPSYTSLGMNEFTNLDITKFKYESLTEQAAQSIDLLDNVEDIDTINNEVTQVTPNPGINYDTQPMKESRQARSFPLDHPMSDYSDVLLVVNDNSTISKQIADYFRSVRNIPDKNICNITAQTAEQVTRAEFNRIRNQIESYVLDSEMEDDINFIITTKGLPIRISSGNWRLRASVDNELCLILGPYATWIDDLNNYQVNNVYYEKEEQFIRSEELPIYLVTRLTGYNFSDVKQLIDNAAASANQRDSGGSFLFDRDLSSNKADNPWRGGNDRMVSAHDDLTANRYTSSVVSSNTFVTDRNNLAGYCSWGTSDNYYYNSPVQNRGLDQPNNEAVDTPTDWTLNNIPFVEDITRNVTINRSARFSVNITRPTNNTGFAYISQNVTIKAGVRYYLSGYVRRVDVANYNGGGAILQIKAYDSIDNLVWMMNNTPRYGGPDTGFVSLYQLPYEPIPGVTKLKISAGIARSKGTAFFDDIALWEIRPKNTYVPGAIAEVYGYSTGYTMTNPHWFYRLTAGDLIMDGITGVKGYVDYANPYINTNTRVNVLFDRYTAGYTLAESFYAASPYMSWIDLVIGDPKCAPYFNVFPDATLEVENITFSDEDVNQGDHVNIQARIENRGGSELSNLQVSYLVGPDPQSAVLLGADNLASVPGLGSSISIFDWNTTDFNGTLTVWVYADYANEFREQNETNNYKSKQITINSYPSNLGFKLSAKDVYRGGNTVLFINISDLETLESELNCSIYFNHSSINAWIMLPNIIYQTDHWQTSFITDASTITGWYDVKIIITDQNNASIELVDSKSFRVLNNPPEVSILEVFPNKINRSENITITFTAYDFETTITEDSIGVYYRESGTSSNWLAGTGELEKDLIFNDYWQFILNSSKTMKPRMYDLRIVILDSDGDSSEVEKLDAFQALNNAPVIERIVLEPTSILRRDFVTIFIYGGDVETSRRNMTVDLEYRLAFEGVSWSELNTTPKTTHWEAVFYTNIATLTGNYTFRVRIKDSNNVWTKYHYPDSELKVLNNPPVAVHNFDFDVLSVNEDEEILFDATNSSDIEDSICSEFLWEFGDGLSSTDPLTSHMYPYMGEYNVTLTVYDKNYGSNTTKITIEVLNIKPTVVTIVDKIQTQVNEPILFDGSGSSDTSSDYVNLTYLWDFDDNTTSNEPKVTHAFTNSGTFSVSLTITDDNGASDTSTLFVTIEPLPHKKRDDGEDGNLLYVMGKIVGIPVLLLLIIIIIILIIIAVVMKKRKAAKEPSIPGMIEEPIETLEADIVETPALGAGKTVKHGRARGTGAAGTGLKPITGDECEEPLEQPEVVIEPGTIPRQTGTISKAGTEETLIPEVEVEYVPDLPKPKPSAVKQARADLPDEEITLEPGVVPSTEEEIQYPLPATVDSEPAEEAADFVPPKIDLPIPEEMVEQEPRPEVEEAMKRGEGLSLDFKRPDKKKQ